MNLLTLKQKIGLTFFKIKKNFELFDRIKKNSLCKKKELSSDLSKFISQGYLIKEKLLNDEDVNYILNHYINIDHIDDGDSFDYNLIIPFFNKKIINKILESELCENLDKFFKLTTKANFHFQTVPYIVITKPLSDQDTIDGKSAKIPVNYHTDFPFEITLQVPLLDLDLKSPHTLYFEKTNRSIFFRSTSVYKEEKLSKFKKINLIGKKGDGILIDTQGVHRANVYKNSIRIMLFIKFSNSKNIITNTNHKNLYEKLKHLDYFKYYNNPQLVKDYEYAKFSKLLKLSQLNIYQDFDII